MNFWYYLNKNLIDSDVFSWNINVGLWKHINCTLTCHDYFHDLLHCLMQWESAPDIPRPGGRWNCSMGAGPLPLTCLDCCHDSIVKGNKVAREGSIVSYVNVMCNTIWILTLKRSFQCLTMSGSIKNFEF